MNLTINIDPNKLEQAILNDPDIKDAMSQQLYSRFIDSGFDEIRSEFTNIAREVIRDVVKEYVENYYERSSIKNDVDRAFRDLTKQEIIGLLSGLIKE
jgi:hypothetical protein